MGLDELRIGLKRKYRLVHVPSRHKAEAWLEAVRSFAAEDSPEEEAGHRGALRVFPYEYRPPAIEDSPRVRDLLEMVQAEKHDPGRSP